MTTTRCDACGQHVPDSVPGSELHILYLMPPILTGGPLTFHLCKACGGQALQRVDDFVRELQGGVTSQAASRT